MVALWVPVVAALWCERKSRLDPSGLKQGLAALLREGVIQVGLPRDKLLQHSSTKVGVLYYMYTW